MDVNASSDPRIDPIEQATMRRVFWRLIPLLMLGYFCAYLDRGNVGMAAPTMSPDLGFSNAVFGFGSGLFFWGYFLAEIPSNLILNRVGARMWFTRILITWGLISGLTAFVWNGWSFYTIRFALGLAEAGFYPGVVLYLTWWFPSYYRTRAMSRFQAASMISLIIGPPIGGLLLNMHGFSGLHGWQWLFILEALPAVIMAGVVWVMLTDRPSEAKWLAPEQRQWLTERLDSERTQRESIRKFSLFEAFTHPKLWLLTLAYFGPNVSAYGLVFFLPMIVKGLGVPTEWIGTVSGVPYIFGFAAMLTMGWHSDHTGERKWHVVSCYFVCAAGLATAALIGPSHPVLVMVMLCVAIMGSNSSAPIFWSLPSAILSGTAAAGGLAMINSVGNLGGWVGPWVYGLVKDATGDPTIGLLCLAIAPAISGVAVLIAGHDRRLERIPPRRG
jgi:MFS transporter, ACS family, tartrate transporter